MNKSTIKEIAVIGISIALVLVATMSIQVPIPGQGYIHVGDGIILLLAAIYGSKTGALAGGLGSFLADLITGYAVWSPFSLVIKGIMGFVAGLHSQDKVFSFKRLIFSFLAIVIMVSGYFLAEFTMTKTFEASLVSLPFNAIQGGGGFVIYLILASLFEKAKIKDKLKDL